MNRGFYSRCFVPSCANTTSNNRKKVFVRVPDTLKLKWCRKLGIEYVAPSRLYCCEDHLDLEEDLENYHYWKLMNGFPKLKSTARLRVKSTNNKNKNDVPRTSERDDIGALETICPPEESPVLRELLLHHEMKRPKTTRGDHYSDIINVPTAMETTDVQVESPEEQETIDVKVQSPEEQETRAFRAPLQETTCCGCSVAIPPTCALARCVQCAEGALFCARCLHNAHAHTTHAIMQLPDTRTYRILEGIFQQLRLDVNELLGKNGSEELLVKDENQASDNEEEPLVEALSDTHTTQDEHSCAQQLDPLSTVIKEEDPTPAEDETVVREVEILLNDEETQALELEVLGVTGNVQPKSKPSVSTAKRKQANADRPGIYPRFTEPLKSYKRVAATRTFAEESGVRKMSSQGSEDAVVKLDPLRSDDQRSLDSVHVRGQHSQTGNPIHRTYRHAR